MSDRVWGLAPEAYKAKAVCAAPRCGWRGKWGDVLLVADPCSDRKWFVCPYCRTPEHTENACEYPGCWRIARYELEANDRVWNLCGKHYDEWVPIELSAPDEPSPGKSPLRLVS
jgi:hypothetical protein